VSAFSVFIGTYRSLPRYTHSHIVCALLGDWSRHFPVIAASGTGMMSNKIVQQQQWMSCSQGQQSDLKACLARFGSNPQPMNTVSAAPNGLCGPNTSSSICHGAATGFPAPTLRAPPGLAPVPFMDQQPKADGRPQKARPTNRNGSSNGNGNANSNAGPKRSTNNNQAGKSMRERGAKHINTFTTVMLCNLENRDETLDVVKHLQNKGWGEKIDFCHKPRQSNQCGGKPYAFVNFKTHEAAVDFKACRNHGLQVEVADVQGLDANCKGWARSNFRDGGKVKSNGIHDRRLWPWVEDSTMWQRYYSKAQAANSSGEATLTKASSSMPSVPSSNSVATYASGTDSSYSSNTWASSYRHEGHHHSTNRSQASSSIGSSPTSPRLGSLQRSFEAEAFDIDSSMLQSNCHYGAEVKVFIPSHDPSEPARLVMTGFDSL